MINNRTKPWISVFLFSLTFLSCNDFAKDLNRAINNPQSKIAFQRGLILDGSKDAAYDKIFSRISDKQDDGNTTFHDNGSDLKTVYLAQDDSYLWVFLEFWDGPPNLTTLPANFRYEINLSNQNDQDMSLYFQVVSSGAGWSIVNTGSTDLSQAEVQVSGGVEVRIIKSLILASTKALSLFIVINDDNNTVYDEIRQDSALYFYFEQPN